MKFFGGFEELFDILDSPFFVYHVYFLHDAWIKDSEAASDFFFADSGIWADEIEVAQNGVFDLCSGFYGVSITDVWIDDITFDSEYVVAAYFHGVVFFGGGFEHYDCSFLYDIIISEDYLEVLIFFLADDGAGGVDDAALAEDDVAYYFIES